MTEDQCGACGERNPAGSAFCVFCGTYLGWDEPGRGPAGAPAATPATPPTATPPPSVDRPPTATAAPAGGPPRVAPQPTPAPVPPQPSPTPSGSACPHCGKENPPTRRFCSKCGYPLVAATAAAPSRPQPAPQRSWWDREARAARREYRRSLPPLYRWRRVVVTLALIVGVALVLTLTGNNPVGWAQDQWRALTVDLEPIDGVTATAEPRGSVADTYGIKKLPGPRQAAWATSWPAEAVASEDCGVTRAAGTIVLSWDEPTRVRGLDVWAGLDADDSERALQFLPKRLGVTFGECVQLNLKDTADRQTLTFDTENEVTSLVITVDDVYPNSAEPQSALVAIGGIELLHQPD